MSADNLNPRDAVSASISVGAGQADDLRPRGRLLVTCTGPDGKVKWSEWINNTVTTVGRNHMEDTYFAGSGYTATWFLGLIGSSGYTTGVVAGDTAASHAGWTENTAYTESTRPAPSFASAASGGVKTSGNATFSINAAGTLKGAFVISNSTKGGTTGTLFAGGTFQSGDRPVNNGDALNVSYQLTLS